MFIAVGLLVFGVELVAYGLISKWLERRRIHKGRIASLRTTEYAPQRPRPITCHNRPGEN